jgi:5-methylcytosine-specific restriction protein A
MVNGDLETIRLEEEYFEGKAKERYTTYYGRNPQLRTQTILIHGTQCKVCGFEFEKIYGKHGAGFIEVHHLRPVSSLDKETKADPLSDMTVVCSNCHRMIHHRKNQVLSIDELRELIKSNLNVL